MPSTDPTSTAAAARRDLGVRLRLLRKSAGLTQPDIAAATRQHVTRVSRVENGGQPPTEQNIRDWCKACGADDQAADLIAAAQSVESAYVEWARRARTGLKRLGGPHSLRTYQRTTLFRVHEPLVMPGIFQTEAYYRAMINFWYEFLDAPNDMEQAVAHRQARTATALQPTKRIVVVLGEQAVRTRRGSVDEHADQLTHLLAMMRRPNVSVGILPADAQRRAIANIGFWIFDDNAVALETPTAAIKVTQPQEIAQYASLFDLLRKEAVHGLAASQLVAGILASIR